jgi:hypothetical protein
MTATIVYLLCAVTSSLCAALLIRQYRLTHQYLLLWSSVAFVGLALNNVLVFTDFVIVPSVDLATLRAAVAAVSTATLLLALIWDPA